MMPRLIGICNHNAKHHHAVSKGGKRAKRHKCIHIRCEVNDTADTVYKEAYIYNHNGKGECHLYHRLPNGSVTKDRGKRCPNHMPHREIHQTGNKNKRGNQAKKQHGCLLFLRLVRFRPILGYTVARLGHSGYNFGTGRRTVNRHISRQKIYRAGGNAVDRADRPLHSCRARRTGHTRNLIFFHRNLRAALRRENQSIKDLITNS